MSLINHTNSKKHITQNVFDGPYVFYDQDNNTEAFYIEENNAYKTDSKQTLSVRFSNHADWDFSFRLKKELKIESCIYANADKIFVLSDIEGEFEAFRKLLISNKIIDEQYHWIFGSGHLVINGDMFDRGNEVTSLLWLLYKLEEDSIHNGGYVHIIIGNHEVMNLSGDLRHVDEKYFMHARALNKTYMQLFDKNTELGRWLRTKNVMEKIGDLLFVHGGVSPRVNALQFSIEEINNNCRPFYDQETDKEDSSLPLLISRQTLYWYRGYFREPFCTIDDINETLRLYDCKQIIVGHTILPDKNPALYYEGKILNVDVDHHNNIHAAVQIEGNHYFVADEEGNRRPLNYE
ncbi:MAG: metallophosphoesterase [Arachidicoccus sp.]|nr:metallophosphoesterase [Arachidicoccus sp.]